MLYDVPTPILIGILLLCMAFAVEAGLRLGRRLAQPTWLQAREVLTGLTAATLGLLGLMLAFSFSQAAGRYDARMSLLVDEASAILVVHRYLDYLRPEQGEEGRDLLRLYAEERVAYLAVGHDALRERRAIERSRDLGNALWRLVQASDNYRSPEPTLRANNMGQLTSTVTAMLVTSREREEARAQTVPPALTATLLLLVTLASGMLAYMVGGTGHPDRVKVYAFLVFVALVVYVIVDLDRPRRGLMRLSPAPLVEAIDIVSRADEAQEAPPSVE